VGLHMTKYNKPVYPTTNNRNKKACTNQTEQQNKCPLFLNA